MKPIKLFSISFLFLINSELFAQKILDGSKFLYLTYGDGPKTTVSIKQIIKTSTGKVNVYKFDIPIILEKNDKVYYLIGNDTVLYYDYSLMVGDTFYFNNPTTRTEFMKIDSIKMIQLNDLKFHKHWYMKSKYQAKPLIWVEGLGEKNFGWYRYDWIWIHTTELKSICQIDTLIFWNTTFNGFEPDIVAPTCDYFPLLKRNNSKEINIQRPVIFPNPANQKATITISNGYIKEIRLYSIDGKLVKDISNINGSEFVIDISYLSQGVYTIVVLDNHYNTIPQKLMIHR